MLDLPLAPEELSVVLDGYDEITTVIAPLTDDQYFVLSDGFVRATDASGEPFIQFNLAQGGGKVFDANVRRIDGLLIGGVPFDPQAQGHLRSVPAPLKKRVVGRLVQYALGTLTQEELGNSKPPASPQLQGSTS